MATAKDLPVVFEKISVSPALVLIRDINGGPIIDFLYYAVGPFTWQTDDEGPYICGYDRRDKQERHLRLVDKGDMKGVVELRRPNDKWFAPEFDAIRIYIHK